MFTPCAMTVPPVTVPAMFTLPPEVASEVWNKLTPSSPLSPLLFVAFVALMLPSSEIQPVVAAS